MSGPSLPTYIVIIDISLLPTDSPPVMPVESPTVPKALVASNKTSISLKCGSSMLITSVAVSTINTPKVAITDAFLKVSFGIE